MSKPKINLTYDISIDDSFELDVEDVDDSESARSDLRDMDMSNLDDQTTHSGRRLHESNSRRISLKTFKLNKLRSIDSKSSVDFNSTTQNNLNFSALKIIENSPKNTQDMKSVTFSRRIAGISAKNKGFLRKQSAIMSSIQSLAILKEYQDEAEQEERSQVIEQ